MASNRILIEVKNRGWLNGFSSLWCKENHGGRGTWSWLMQILIWIVIVDGMLALIMFNDSIGTPPQVHLITYFIFAAMAVAIGATILAQDAILDERKMGTAAWILSKPVARTAFLLAKLFSNLVRTLITMVLMQGFVTLLMFKIATRISLSIPGFLAGLGLVYLFLIFFLAMTLMLSTLFHSRGPVIGIPLVLIIGSQYWITIPWLGKFTPTSLIMGPMGASSLPAALAQGQPLPTVTPIITTGLLILIFIIVTIVRFGREEF